MKRRIFLLIVIGFFSSLILFPTSSNPINFKSDKNYPYLDPPLNELLSSFGESPFDFENLFQDSDFKDGITWWNYTSSNNITSKWDSIDYCANISHFSNASSEKYIKYSQIQNAFYPETNSNFTSEFLDNDGTASMVKRWINLDVYYSYYINNGDNIPL